MAWALSGCLGEELPPPELPGEPSESVYPLAVTDDGGREVVLEAEPRRIVSLVPAATEALHALGMGDRLVGRTDYDLEPAFAHLPSVGGGLHPSVERLVALDPELVIVFEGEQDRATPRALEAAGIPHLSTRPENLEDIHRMVRMLARAVDAPEAGEALARRMDAELDRLRRLLSGEPTVRVAFLLGGDPPWVAGRGTHLHELLEVARGENVFGDSGPLHAPVSVEEVVRRDPELLLAPEGASVPRGLSHLPLHRVPLEVLAPGHRVGISAVEIARLLHPERGW